VKGFSPEFMEALCTYNWPGNVRELVNALESAIAAALHENILYPKHLPTHIRVHLIRGTVNKKDDTATPPVNMTSLKERRELIYAREERQYLLELMATTRRNIQEACEISGLRRARLYQLIKKHGIEIPD
jgi:two-component system NtrC family response regulator